MNNQRKNRKPVLWKHKNKGNFFIVNCKENKLKTVGENKKEMVWVSYKTKSNLEITGFQQLWKPRNNKMFTIKIWRKRNSK